MNLRLKIVAILTSIFITFVLIISAVNFSLNFRTLYYFDVDYFKLPQTTNVSKTEILDNYNTLIDYLKPSFKGELQFPTFPMSHNAKIHFEDVKNLFIKLDYLMYVSILLSLIGIGYLYKKRDYLFYRFSAIFLIVLPILLILPLVINFDKAFTIFHQIAFRNDYWLFDPTTDPIINVLPEGFFMHTALLILVIITIESLLLNFLYRFHVKHYLKKRKMTQ